MSESFDRVVSIMATLRAPGGCPWDRKQTHESLKPYLLEETYEVLETIDHRDQRKLKEELGDVLLQVLFHSQIASEQGTFTVVDVVEQLADKLVRRHPHVFNCSPEQTGMNSEQVLHSWEEIKRAERRQSGQSGSVLHDIPKALPALLRAYQVQARAARVGFDWPDNAQGLRQVCVKVDEEFRELYGVIGMADRPEEDTSPKDEALPADRHEAIEAELGDVLFSLVNLARHLKVNPEDALRRATNRFAARFRFIEDQAAGAGKTIGDLSLEDMDRYWEQAKAAERAGLNAGFGRRPDAKDTES